MSLTAQSAVIRRLVLSPGPAAPEGPPGPHPAVVQAALSALGRAPSELPVRTVVLLAADTGAGAAVQAPSPADASVPAAEPAPFPVRSASTTGRALRLAHRDLLRGTADLVLVVGPGASDTPDAPGTPGAPGASDAESGAAAEGPAPGAITVYAVKRAAEAVADGDPVLGVLDVADAGDQDAVPPLRPLRHGRRDTDPDRHRLLLWSGRDEADETRVRGELLPLLGALHCEAFPSLPTAVPCGTAPGPVRGAAVTVARLAAGAVHKARAAAVPRPRPVALLFPGQGSQHHAMAAGLYRREPVFTAAVDAALSHMGPEGPRIREDWLTTGRPAVEIDDVRRAQPLLFAVDYGLGRMILSWGVRPAALLGHSAGELVAATIAGVMSLSDAVGMVMARVREAVKIPPGGMLAVAAGADQLRPYLTPEVAIAAVNARQQVMLAGSAAPLAEVAARLRADGLTVVTVPATSPFHSPAMAPASDALEETYAAVPLRAPSLPLYSGYTGGPMRPEDARSPRFWARQVTDTVHFLPALDELLAADDVLLIEAGPRQTLTAFARRHRAVRLGASAALALLPARPGTQEADRQSTLTVAARLWTEGHTPNPEALSHLWTWSDAPRPAPADPRSLAPALSP